MFVRDDPAGPDGPRRVALYRCPACPGLVSVGLDAGTVLNAYDDARGLVVEMVKQLAAQGKHAAGIDAPAR